MLKTKYIFLRRLYNDYVIVFFIRGRYLVRDRDKNIYYYFNKEKLINNLRKGHINYVLLDYLEVIEIMEYEDNRYLEILYKGIMMLMIRDVYCSIVD